MSINLVVFLTGLFGAPAGLLYYGHRLQRRDRRGRRVFWGAVIGHWVAGCTAITFGMIPPEAWTAGEVLRGFFGYWSLLVFPVVGAAIGAGISSRARNGRMEPILSSSWQEEI